MLRPGQVIACLIAGLGVLNLTFASGQFPWISLSLALSFALYGLIRKQTPVDAVLGLAAETLVLLPASVIYLAWLFASGAMVFGTQELQKDGLLALSGVVTSIPLLLFAGGARRLRLTTLGFLQYLAPTLQFLVAVVINGEAFRRVQFQSFLLIWTAILVFLVDSVLARQATIPVAGGAGED